MTPPGVRARPWHSAPATARADFLRRSARLVCSCLPPEQGSFAPKNILPRSPAPRRSESPRQMYAAPPPAFPLAGSATAESPACTSGPSAETFAPIRDTRTCRLLRFQTAVPRAQNRQPASETKPTQAAPREKTRSADPARKSAHPLWDRTPRTHDREIGARQWLLPPPLSLRPARGCPASPPAPSSRTPRRAPQGCCPCAAACCAKK